MDETSSTSYLRSSVFIGIFVSSKTHLLWKQLIIYAQNCYLALYLLEGRKIPLKNIWLCRDYYLSLHNIFVGRKEF